MPHISGYARRPALRIRHPCEQPTAFQAPDDLLPYTHQPIMVVGCGTQPATHPGQPHLVPQGNPVTHANVSIGLGACSMDVNATMTPHRVGSFWIADHTEDLPGGAVRLIYFENLPGNLFANRGWCLTAARTAHRLLDSVNTSMVLIRAGLGAICPGQPAGSGAAGRLRCGQRRLQRGRVRGCAGHPREPVAPDPAGTGRPVTGGRPVRWVSGCRALELTGPVAELRRVGLPPGTVAPVSNRVVTSGARVACWFSRVCIDRC
jgi:hypothetical protein